MSALRIVAALLGVLLGVAALAVSGTLSPIESTDVAQLRLDRAMPLVPEGQSAVQELLPRHNGLSGVEVQVARWENASGAGPLTLRLHDERGALVAEQRWAAEELHHNELLTLRFPPQAGSAGQRYDLSVDTGGGPFSLWGYSLDARAGTLTIPGAAPAVRELRYRTLHTLTWGGAAAQLSELLAGHGPLWALALLLISLPGLLVLLARPALTGHWDAGVWVAVAVALGLALWPLLWAALSAVGGRWSGPLLWALLALGWVAVLARGWQQRKRLPRASTAHALLLLLLIAALVLRALAVRDLAFPPWVDSVRHGLIASVMAESGRVIESYRPWLAVDRFPYHWGFHVLPAMLMQMTGRVVTELLLAVGQLLNVLALFAVYAAAWLMTRRRGLALLATFLTAFPFLFPGYYATWGRYTQLAGMVLLPVLTGLLWRMVRGRAQEQHLWWLVALLASGLFLTHVRLFIYWLPLPLLLWLWSRRHTRALLAAGLLTLLLVGWRAWQLWPRGASAAGLVESFEGYNAFPTSYFTTGWEPLWVALAGVALLVALWGVWRRWRGAGMPLLLAAWVVALFISLAGERLGLPESWLVNLNSMAITLYFPMALGVAWLLTALWRRSAHAPRALALGRWTLAGAFLSVALLFGARQQMSILNSETLLARPADAAALRWMAEQLPPDALVAVSSWQWLGGTWSATDGGAWIVPLTGRGSTAPPADYIYDTALAAQVDEFNRWAASVEDWSAPTVAAELRARGVTHLYVGAKGGFLDPAALNRNEALRLLFQWEGVWLFELFSVGG